MNPYDLPKDLPVPEDDGAAGHLAGLAVPRIALPSTAGEVVDLSALSGRTVVYAYPRTAVPGEPLFSDEWDQIPGARGCTPESCAFRDHHAELQKEGAAVFGLSTQSTAFQQELATRLHLPFAILSDEKLAFQEALNLPVFVVNGQKLLKRLTLILRDGVIEHVFYPVFPPDTHAEDVLHWLRANPKAD